MAKFRIVTDGSCDLPEELIRERDITVVPFYVLLDGPEYQRQNVEVSTARFYDWMLENPGRFPKSSAPSAQDFYEVFSRCAAEGEPVLCINITTKFSSAYQSAVIARQMVMDEKPSADIRVMNSMVNTVLQGQFVLEACRLRDAERTSEEAYAELERIRPTGRILFTIGGIDYLQKGGRIGKLAGRVSAMLNIRPIITLSEGEIHASGMVRGRPKSLDKTLEVAKSYIEQTFAPGEEFSMSVGYGTGLDEAYAFRERVLSMLRETGSPVEVPIYRISSVIAVHTGPYPLGVGILRRAEA